MANGDLYSECPMGYCDKNCILCEGKGFIKARITVAQVDTLREYRNRTLHTDRYFIENKEALDTYVDWLRKNPYPKL